MRIVSNYLHIKFQLKEKYEIKPCAGYKLAYWRQT